MSSFRSRSENDHSHSTIDNRAYSNINDEDDDEEEDDNFDEDDEESDVENNGNDDYYENPEELRINNISRNNLFLASLGIEVKNDVINQEKNEEIVIENEIDNTINSNNNEYIKDEIEKKMKLDNLIYYQSFYLRKNEISRIIGYLDRNMVPAPPLLITGPTGSGKTSCCKYALSTFDIPFVSVSCEGYSTIRQFVRQLWNNILETIRKLSNGQKFLGNGIYKDSFENWRFLQSAPFNFSTLIQSLQTLLDSSFYRWPCLNILFDRIDKASKLEIDLPSRLLNLAEFAHFKIKIIANTRLFSINGSKCIGIIMTPYSSDDLSIILSRKAKDSIIIDKKNDINSDIIIEYVKTVLTLFDKMVKEVLPLLLNSTNHVGQIWEGVKELWRRNMRIGDAKNCFRFNAEDIFLLSKNSPEYNNNSESNIQPYLITPLSSVTFKESFSLLRELPVFSININKNNQLQNNKNKKKKMEDVDIQKNNQNLSIDISTLRALGWTNHLPNSHKYLLVSIFLASNNKKESDDYTFGTHQRGKRRKVRKGTDNNEAEQNSSSRFFKLDRLMSIFTTISCHGSKNLFPRDKSIEIDEKYGDSFFFSTIPTFIEQKHLIYGPGYSFDQPSFSGTVTFEMAQELSTSLKFNLQDFIYSEND